MTGQEYKELREALGLSRVALAQTLGVALRTIYRLEAAEYVPERDQYAIAGVVAALQVKSIDSVEALEQMAGKPSDN